MDTILITGVAGFIGFHLANQLLKENYQIIGLDNLNEYYNKSLKKDRLAQIKHHQCFTFVRADLIDEAKIEEVFSTYRPKTVIHLAAQAGVQYSLENPHAFVQSNIVGFMNILEACRCYQVEHLIYASSSSVYGANTTKPFSTRDNIDHPISLYAATKKSNELMAHTYSHLYHLPTTGLRFFTVYGPWGRPDMALFLFTKAILQDEPINVFNYGEMVRDFTYIDDIVESITRLLDHPPKPNPNWRGDQPDPSSSYAPYKVYNIGNNNPVHLMDFIKAIEKRLGKKAKKNFLPLQPGDVPETYADIEDLSTTIQFKPNTPIQEGVNRFIDWYLDYYEVNL